MNMLICGLGGGLDVVNALFFKILLSKYNNIYLGSIQPLLYQRFVKNVNKKRLKTINDQCYEVNKGDKITQKGRWAEPLLAEQLNEPVYIFSRRAKNGSRSVDGLAKSFDDFCEKKQIDKIIFVDGGGDALTLTKEDIPKEHYVKSPFDGGDSFALEAISKMNFPKDISLAVVAPGLDIDYTRFMTNLINLKEEGIYFENLDLLDDSLNRNYFDLIEKYKNIAKEILYLDESDPNKIKSHTATVFYHSLCENYGIQRTYVTWEGFVGETPGVMVNAYHKITYEFDAKKIHDYKLKLNKN